MDEFLNLSNFTQQSSLGKGSFAEVYKVKEISTGKIYAAKVIDCGDDENECNRVMDREVGIMICTKHPTINKIIGYSTLDFQEENNVTIIMEYAKNGSLLDVINNIQ